MKPLLTAAEMRRLDEFTIREVGLPGAVLMETAGRGVVGVACSDFGDRVRSGPTAVFCGKGNNGGDGFVAARCLANRGFPVTACLLGRREEVRSDAAVHLGAYLASGGALLEVGEANRAEGAALAARAALVVDAVLGTGLREEVAGLAAEAVGWINGAAAPVVSVDVPSGVCSDTGQVRGAAVRADRTVTFAWPKRGHYLHPGAALAGRLSVVDIGVPPAALSRVEAALRLLEPADVAGLLSRPADAHKGTFGHVFVLGGSPGKDGAPGLAAWAALRAGAGLSTVAWPAALGRSASARLPLEVMTELLPDPGSAQTTWSPDLGAAAEALERRADALVVGPGLGTGEGPAAFLARVLGSEGPPLVLDADALNALAADPTLGVRRLRRAVLTPHPGEAARLLGSGVRSVQADRPAAARELAARFGAVVVLKGAHTLVAAQGEPTALVAAGNPGMATAGTGDVLAGVVGALLARGLTPLEAARLGAYAHGLAGDVAAARLGLEGLTAGDVLAALPEAMKRVAGDDGTP